MCLRKERVRLLPRQFMAGVGSFPGMSPGVPGVRPGAAEPAWGRIAAVSLLSTEDRVLCLFMLQISTDFLKNQIYLLYSFI